MEKKWNPEQLEAIYSRNANILVSAGAGSGKTAVLVERITEMICDPDDPCDINRLLVVTFTKKAAAEMRERITGELLKRIQKDPENKNLRRQFGLLSRARISTIHSFCLEMIRNNFGMVSLDPDFRIIDENLNSLLREKALEAAKEAIFEDDGLFSLFDYYGFGRRGDAIDEIVDSLHKALASQPFPHKWLERSLSYFTGDTIVSQPYIKTILDITSITLKGVAKEIEGILSILSTEETLDVYIPVFEEALGKLEQVIKKAGKGFESAREALDSFSFSTLKRTKEDVNIEMKEYIQKTKSELSGRIKDLYRGFFSLEPASIVAQNNSYGEIFKKAVRLYEIFDTKFIELKRKHNAIDYNDMEHLCLEILLDTSGDRMKPTHAAVEMRGSIDHIFIDEYQDSNLLQEYILFTVSKCDEGINNVFMVGDVKQSIYRFRLAMPEIFIKKYDEYSSEEGSPKRKINLQKNYRSRREIISFVNTLFSGIMTKNAGELDYGGDQELEAARVMTGLPDQRPLGIILFDKKEELSSEFADYENSHKEALILKELITDLVACKKLDDGNGGLRDIQYRDIVILTRSNKGFSSNVRDVLLGAGIPVFAEGEEGYYDQLEIRTAIALLNVIDNSLQDIDMIAVMRSFIGGFGLDEITRIRLMDRAASVYNNLLCASDHDHKCFELISLLLRFKAMKNDFRLHEFIMKLLEETYFIEYFRALPAGELRTANLRLFIQRARDFEENMDGSLFSFLGYISGVSKSGSTPESARTVAENENVVRIMTIHSSKGLQFPCVILANTGKRFNRADERGKLLTHRELGAGPEIIDRQRKIRYDSIIKKAIMGKVMLENISEEMRVLYVALTRAEQRLYITGGKADLQSAMEGPGAVMPLSEYRVIHSACFLDWILKGNKDPGLISIADVNELVPDEAKQEEQELSFADAGSLSEKTLDKINWIYPYQHLSKYPAKVTVTELKKFKYDLISPEAAEVDMTFDYETIRPDFLGDIDMLNPRERGVLYHYVMQLLDFGKIDTPDDVRRELENYVDMGYISEKEHAGIDPRYLYRFFSSGLGSRCKKAGKLYRETPFNVELKEIGSMGSHPVLQGVIDLFFEEDGGIVLIDYKTDLVSKGQEEMLIQRYKKQIEYYAYALSVITGKKVKEKYIYSFFLSKEIQMQS